MLSKYNFIEQYVELFLSSYKILNRLIEEDKQLTDVFLTLFTPTSPRNIPIKWKKKDYKLGVALAYGSNVAEALVIRFTIFNTFSFLKIDHCLANSSSEIIFN